LSKAQENDSDLNLIRSCLQTKVEPQDNILFLASPAAKKHVINKEQFSLMKMEYCGIGLRTVRLD
jgi:hypothetical protein